MKYDYYTVGQDSDGMIVLSHHKYGQGVYTQTFTQNQAMSIYQLLGSAMRQSYTSRLEPAIEDIIRRVLVELEFNGYPGLVKDEE
jgi:hypothetical protein